MSLLVAELDTIQCRREAGGSPAVTGGRQSAIGDPKKVTWGPILSVFQLGCS